MIQIKRTAALLLVSFLLLLSGCDQRLGTSVPSVSLDDIPAFADQPYVVLNNNEPDFSQEDKTTESFEQYSALDSLGRCGTAFANLGVDLMPSEERESIGQVKPTGWHTVKYDCVDGTYLYNRCHLIGYQLSGENANECNLITGTRYLNVEGMLPFENLVHGYVEETENHVLYRVTPLFEGENLLASGVQMEALSVEDEGEGVCFNVYVYNCQPGVTIDYATGESWLTEDTDAEEDTPDDPTSKVSPGTEETVYILNTSSHKFHVPDCSGVASMKERNRETYTGSRETLLAEGYTPCGQCNP